MVHELLTSLGLALVGLVRSRAALLAENALLRQQVIVLKRAAPHPRLKARDLHAERILREYLRHYHGRPHRGLRMQAPVGGRWLPPVRPVPAKAVRSRPVLGGLHHQYTIAA